MISTDANWQAKNALLQRQPLWILVIDGIGYVWGNFTIAQLQPAVAGYGTAYGAVGGYGLD
jgi:hypothetical protein